MSFFRAVVPAHSLIGLFVLSSCVEWTTPQMQQERIPLATPIVALRTDALPGSGGLLADGTFRFQIDLAHVCRRSELVKERVTVVEHKVFSRPGQISMVAGAGAIVLGIVLAATAGSEPAMAGMPSSKSSTATTGASLIVVGLPAIGVPAYYRYAKGPTRRDKVVGEKDIPSSEVDVPCEGFAPAQVLGELEVQTPWGAKLRGPIGTDGSTQIALDWATTGIDPRDPDIARRLGMAWRVRSTRTGLAVDWSPAVADRDTEMKLVQIASAGKVGAPPELVVVLLAADGGSLVAGQRNTIRLTVENRGGGVARKLVAKARSSHAAIDDKTFDFGDLGAGETKTRYIDVELAGDESATTITMVAEFSMDTHKPPPNATAQLTVTPRLCPPDKLTKPQYEAKRAKLQKLVKDGLLKEEEFQRYDAILLGCRK